MSRNIFLLLLFAVNLFTTAATITTTSQHISLKLKENSVVVKNELFSLINSNCSDDQFARSISFACNFSNGNSNLPGIRCEDIVQVFSQGKPVLSVLPVNAIFNTVPFSQMSSIDPLQVEIDLLIYENVTQLITHVKSFFKLQIFLKCPIGTFSISGTSENGSCEPCPKNTFANSVGTNPVCTSCPNQFPATIGDGSTSEQDCKLSAFGNSFTKSNGKIESCKSFKGIACNFVGAKTENLIMISNYWRNSSSSLQIKKCIHSGYCVGNGNQTSLLREQKLDICRKHHKGVLCESCQDGFQKFGGFNGFCINTTTCPYQPANLNGIIFLLFLGLVWLILLPIIVSWIKPPFFFQNLKLFQGCVALIISYFQIIGGICATINEIDRSPIANQLSIFFSLCGFDILTVFDAGCLFKNVSLYQSLLISSLMFFSLILAAFSFIYLILGKCYFSRRRNTFEKIYQLNLESRNTDQRRRMILLSIVKELRGLIQNRMRITKLFFNMIEWLVLLTYPGIAFVILRNFPVIQLETSGVTFLKFQPSIEVGSVEYLQLISFSIIMLTLFVCCIPLLSFLVGYFELDDSQFMEEDNQISYLLHEKNLGRKTIQIFSQLYKSKYYYWESISFIQKVLQTSIIIFLPDQHHEQYIYLVIVTVLYMYVLMIVQPYYHYSLNFLNLLLNMFVLWIAFILLIIPDQFSQQMLLIASISYPILSVLVTLYYSLIDFSADHTKGAKEPIEHTEDEMLSTIKRLSDNINQCRSEIMQKIEVIPFFVNAKEFIEQERKDFELFSKKYM